VLIRLSLKRIFWLRFWTLDAIRNASINPEYAKSEKWGHRSKPICRDLFRAGVILTLSSIIFFINLPKNNYIIATLLSLLYFPKIGPGC